MSGSGVASLTLLRLERALRRRLRYRYVRPQVLQEGDALQTKTPSTTRSP